MKKSQFIYRLSCIAITLVFSLSSLKTYANGADKSFLDYQITKNEKDNSLIENEALFVFTFKNITDGVLIKDKIKGACNGIEKDIFPDANGQYSLKITPEDYRFQFFYQTHFYEIETDTIKAESAHRIEIAINFRSTEVPMMMKKPVIYVYPETTSQLNIKLDLKGEFVFTYPPYNNGWDFVADPNGTIHLDNKEYKYLFWDGMSQIKMKTIDWEEGFVVERGNLLTFFEEKLTAMGLSSIEQQDYITYWVPLMNKNKKNYIHFIFNEEYNEYANISITPKPDNMLRVFMLWSGADEMGEIKLQPQILPSLQREGLTVIEWGGSEMNQIPFLF